MSEQVLLAAIGTGFGLISLLVLNLVMPSMKWRQDELGKVREAQSSQIILNNKAISDLREEVDTWQEKFYKADKQLAACEERAKQFSIELADIRNRMQELTLRVEVAEKGKKL